MIMTWQVTHDMAGPLQVTHDMAGPLQVTHGGAGHKARQGWARWAQVLGVAAAQGGQAQAREDKGSGGEGVGSRATHRF